MTRLIDADALSKDLEKRWNVNDDQDFCNKEVWHALEEAPTIEQPTGDLISRQDAIDAVWKLDKEATEYVVDDDREIHGYCTAIGVCVGELSSLPSAEPKTKCIAQIRIDRDDMEDLINEKVNEIVDKMAEPKTGEWMRLEREENVYDIHGVPTWGVNYMCDKCGFITTAIQDHFGQYKWCPSCGADMRGEEE